MTKSITLNYTVAALVAVALVFFSAAPAFAAINSSYIKIEAKNAGTINNYTSSKAYTGYNTAGGSYGGSGGEGGDVEAEANSGDANGNNGGALAGDGGNGGNANLGGKVETGDATSVAETANSLNATDVEFDVNGDMNSTKIKIEANNAENCECNTIDNETKSRARTGRNTAEGSYGGSGGEGGEIEAEAEGSGDANGNNGGAVAGEGGNGGTGDEGGWVVTGEADSTSTTVNLLNTLLVRFSIL